MRCRRVPREPRGKASRGRGGDGRLVGWPITTSGPAWGSGGSHSRLCTALQAAQRPAEPSQESCPAWLPLPRWTTLQHMPCSSSARRATRSSRSPSRRQGGAGAGAGGLQGHARASPGSCLLWRPAGQVHVPAGACQARGNRPKVAPTLLAAVDGVCPSCSMPFCSLQVLSAKLAKTTGGVTHHLRLLLSHGTQPDSVYEVRKGLLPCAPVLSGEHGRAAGRS